MTPPLHHYRVRYFGGMSLDVAAPDPERAKAIAAKEYPELRIMAVEWLATKPKLRG